MFGLYDPVNNVFYSLPLASKEEMSKFLSTLASLNSSTAPIVPTLAQAPTP